VLLIDLATLAGGVGGGITGCIATEDCLRAYPSDATRAKTAIAALIGGALGFTTGFLVTRNVDRNTDDTPGAPTSTVMLWPAPRPTGGVDPLITAIGVF
ncbi:MAG TPA: hypothetical protein VMU50_03690, partial [Polyangia bacterium]|nr:hypothetical protein [Polyangia bacterium]